MEPYVRGLPFLRIEPPSKSDEMNDRVLQFGKHLQSYMTKRRITRVVLHNAGSYILPLSEAEARRRGALESTGGGFEISLRVETIHRMLTSLAHEIGHTYFYDLSVNPPNLILSEAVLSEREWYAQFEGLAYDFGREVLLPRKVFQEYVRLNHARPSLSSFQRICEELRVSKEIVSQRLLRDMRLWDACIFWGRVTNITGTLQHARGGPQIVVGNRDKRKADFPNLSLSRELASGKSELRKIILETREQGAHAGLHIVVARMHVVLDIQNKHLPNGDRYFTALLYPLRAPPEGERGKQLSIDIAN
jgi:hypothetical protein